MPRVKGQVAKRYSPQERDQALLAIITEGGTTRAHEFLKSGGLDIPRQTLDNWNHKHRDRMAELHERYRDVIEGQMVQQWRETALAAQAVAQQAIQQTSEDLEAGKVKDASSAAKNMLLTAAVATDKMLVQTDRPSAITQHRSVDELTRKLEQLGVIEGTAVEVPPAQELEGGS